MHDSAPSSQHAVAGLGAVEAILTVDCTGASGAGAAGGEMELLMHHLLSQQHGGHLSPHLNGASTSSQMHPLAPPPARACGVTGGGRTLRELREQVQPSGSRSRLQHLPGGYRPMPVAPSPASAPAAMTIAGSVVEIDEID